MTKRDLIVLEMGARLMLLLGLIVVCFFTMGPVAPAAQAQDQTYDYAWLQKVVGQPDMIDQINAAWETRDGDNWRAGQAGEGTYDIVAHSVVIGSKVGGNDPAFQSLAPNVWYTPEGGRFMTTEGYRAFQLDGAVHAVKLQQPKNVKDVIAMLNAYSTYGEKINLLDGIWTGNNPNVVNRWGSSGWQELLTAEAQDMLKDNGLHPAPLMQQLPGDVMVWGELCPSPNPKWGLARVSENIYRTAGLGGWFCTNRGFRAMQIK